MTIQDAITHLSRDRRLAAVIRRVGDCRIRVTRNKYESLVGAIITQQLSGSAARSIKTKFAALYASRFPKPADVVRTSDAKLRKTGLSKMKVAYIKDISGRIESGELKLQRLQKLSDEEVIEELTRIRGIGRWTAEMFLIFTLRRMDVLPVGDLGLKKGVKKLRRMEEMPSEDHIRKVAERWRPYRTVATWYLWRSLEPDSA